MDESLVKGLVGMKLSFDKLNLPEKDRYAMIGISLGWTDPETGIVEYPSYYNLGDGSWKKITN